MGVLAVTPRNLEGKKLGTGLKVSASHSGGGILGEFSEVHPGVYAAPLTSPTEVGIDAFTVSVDDGTGNGVVTIKRGATCRFISPPVY